MDQNKFFFYAFINIVQKLIEIKVPSEWFSPVKENLNPFKPLRALNKSAVERSVAT